MVNLCLCFCFLYSWEKVMEHEQVCPTLKMSLYDGESFQLMLKPFQVLPRMQFKWRL